MKTSTDLATSRDVDSFVISDTPNLWPTLARAILDTNYSCYGRRRTLEWIGRCWFHWCCGERMRKARVRYINGDAAIGWQIAPWKNAACGRCGQIKQVL